MISRRRFSAVSERTATDTIISYILGSLSLVFLILSIVKSIVSKGNVAAIYGVLMLSGALMSITGIVFGVTGYYNDRGGMYGKKMAIRMNVVLVILFAIFLIKGL